MFEDLEGHSRQAHLLYLLEFGKAAHLFGREHAFLKGKENATLEEGDVGRGHLLPGDNHARADGRFGFLREVCAAHLRASRAVVEILE